MSTNRYNGFLGSSVVTCPLKTNRDLGVLNKQNRRKHSKNSRCDNVWSSSNDRRVGSIDWSFVELMSTNFNGRTSHETRCCEIRSSLALGGSDWMCAVKWKINWKLIQTFCPKSSHFFLFPRMKRDLKGKRFQNVEEMRVKTTEALKTITLQEFQNCFEQWKKRWDKCIDSQGEYFDGD